MEFINARKKVLSESEKQSLKSDILLDIYYYKKSIEENHRLSIDDQNLIKDKIKEAELLYKSI